MGYIEIQNEVIDRYRIDICDGTKCRNDWHRTHAHVKIRRVCKWKQRNSIQSTFTLFHEIGHVETTKTSMRRAEREYYATVWAIEKCQEYGLEIPDEIINRYQEYIDMEIDRGVRRGGKGYGELQLENPNGHPVPRDLSMEGLIEVFQMVQDENGVWYFPDSEN